MLTHFRPLIFLTASITMLLTPLTAHAQQTERPANWPANIAIRTEAGQRIPAGAYGVVRIETPRVATLLQLRGVMGRGSAIMRSDNNRDCLSLPIRFIAGDFGGDSISTHTTEPIRLIIRTAGISKALARGEDVVSDMYRISSQINDPSADIIIESGLSDNHGFVLNPGSSVVADVFGTKATRTACSEV